MTDKEYLPLRVVLPITSIGIVLSAIDGSIVNVSLRTMANSLQVSSTDISWVVITYLLVITATIGLGGALGDVYGRKKIFQMGMFIFAIASLLCSLSTSLHLLVMARIIQAIGAAGIMSNGLAIVISFIDPKIRGRAIGINSLVVAGSLTVGPVLGGILTEFYGWPMIFMINVPIGLFGLIAVQYKIPETDTRDIIPDYLGVFYFGLMVFSLIFGSKNVFDEKVIFGVGFLLVSLISGILFVRQENRYPYPMLSIEVMKNRQIIMGVISAIFLYFSINGISFLFPFFLQDIMHFSQSKTGMYMIVLPVAMSLFGPPTGFLAEKIKARVLASTGAFLQTLGIYTLAMVLIVQKEHTSVIFITVMFGLNAAFISLFTNSNGTSVMNATPKYMLSAVSGSLNLSRNIGFTLGTAISSALFFNIFLEDPSSSNYVQSYYTGLGKTYLIFSAICLLGAIFSLLRGTEIILKE